MDNMKFATRESEVLKHVSKTMKPKNVPDTNPFTQHEKQELLAAFESGGTLLYISTDPNLPTKVMLKDQNGGIKEGQQLSKEVSLKLFELYNDPIPSGFHCIFLSGIIEQYCK